MPKTPLPERPSLEYLKKLAKDRLRALRRKNRQARHAEALLAVARDHGFASWRALKEEVDRRLAGDAAAFVDACERGDLDAVREALARDPRLARATHPRKPHTGWTGLHGAAARGHLAIVRLLLEQGADPNAREAGDHTIPLHWAAAHGHVDVMRALLDAGADVHGAGDLHEGEVIGWATAHPHPESLRLLIDRGARHHIFSAIAVGDLTLIRQVVAKDPKALARRRSRFEQGRTPLHEAIDRKRYDILDLLIELGADLEAKDLQNRTPLAVAMLRGDREAMRRLHDAGATPPGSDASSARGRVSQLAQSVKKGVPMIGVPDVEAALAWYVSIGFTELARFGDDGPLDFGMVSFGGGQIMFNLFLPPAPKGVSLWFYTSRVDDIYKQLKARQLEAAASVLAGRDSMTDGIVFEQDIEDMFYGARQFSVRDLNGYEVVFIQPNDA
jgi:ankyrin repeat protein